MVAVSGFEVAWFAGHYSFVGWVTKEQPKIFLTAVQAYMSQKFLVDIVFIRNRDTSPQPKSVTERGIITIVLNRK